MWVVLSARMPKEAWAYRSTIRAGTLSQHERSQGVALATLIGMRRVGLLRACGTPLIGRVQRFSHFPNSIKRLNRHQNRFFSYQFCDLPRKTNLIPQYAAQNPQIIPRTPTHLNQSPLNYHHLTGKGNNHAI